MRWVVRLVLVLAVCALGVWLWKAFHPSPESVIRSRFHRLAQRVSFGPKEGDLARLANAAGLTEFFTDEVEVRLRFRQFTQEAVLTREEIQGGALRLRQELARGLNVEFLDLIMALSLDLEQATVELTMKATAPGEKDFTVQEMKFGLRKFKDQWLIHRVETVKTLK